LAELAVGRIILARKLSSPPVDFDMLDRGAGFCAVEFDRARELFVAAAGGFEPPTEDRREVRGAGLLEGTGLVSGFVSPCFAADDAVGAVR